jgi:uncharacterized protein YfkK (UPF0435 family)
MCAVTNQENLVQVIKQISTSLNIDIQEYISENGEFNAEQFSDRVNQLTEEIDID